MIWPLLALVGFGWVVSSKAKPKTALSKLTVLGPRSGETWDAELFPDAGLVVVHSKRGDGTLATFRKDPGTSGAGASPGRPRYVFSQGKGSATLIAMMREDFEGEKTPL